MKDVINTPVDKEIIRHVILNELEPRVSGKMSDVRRAACNEIIDTDNRMPLCDEPIAEMRTQKTCTTGDYRSRHEKTTFSLGSSGNLQHWNNGILG